jgi:hypothetical protein
MSKKSLKISEKCAIDSFSLGRSNATSMKKFYRAIGSQKKNFSSASHDQRAPEKGHQAQHWWSEESKEECLTST